MNRVRRFINEAWSELKKVSWPTAANVRTLTILVFAISLVVGAYITAFDFLFQGVVALLVPAA